MYSFVCIRVLGIQSCTDFGIVSKFLPFVPGLISGFVIGLAKYRLGHEQQFVFLGMHKIQQEVAPSTVEKSLIIVAMHIGSKLVEKGLAF